jgi:hypothetical protein
MSACGRPEDPARVELRERVKQDARLSNEELGRLLDEVGRTVQGKTFRIKDDAGTRDLTEDQRDVVFGMLTDRAGLYDEGPRLEAGTTVRVLNAPGVSSNAEIEASRRLWVDVETFLPRRFEFAYAFPGYGDYSFDLVVER